MISKCSFTNYKVDQLYSIAHLEDIRSQVDRLFVFIKGGN